MTDPAYVLARRVLLDALAALREHRASVVLVGAQAVYLRVGEGEIPVAPYTTDGDLAVDPRGLRDEPLPAAALEAASLHRRPGSPGVWLGAHDVQIDLLVPEELGGRPGRRGAHLGPHGRDVSRQVRGLAAAVVDRSTMSLTALDPADDRSFEVEVAGKAGLLVAKLHKIDDRSGTPRQGDEDALDVLRLLRGSLPGELARPRSTPCRCGGGRSVSGRRPPFFPSCDRRATRVRTRSEVPTWRRSRGRDRGRSGSG